MSLPDGAVTTSALVFVLVLARSFLLVPANRPERYAKAQRVRCAAVHSSCPGVRGQCGTGADGN